MNTLFLITHTGSFNTTIQALQLVFQICSQTLAESTSSSSKNSIDRFYRTMYESLFDIRLMTSSKQAMYLNLMFKALKADTQITRVMAFVKRLLQGLGMHQPPFICGALYCLGEVSFDRIHEISLLIRTSCSKQHRVCGVCSLSRKTTAMSTSSMRLRMAKSSRPIPTPSHRLSIRVISTMGASESLSTLTQIPLACGNWYGLVLDANAQVYGHRSRSLITSIRLSRSKRNSCSSPSRSLDPLISHSTPSFPSLTASSTATPRKRSSRRARASCSRLQPATALVCLCRTRALARLTVAM